MKKKIICLFITIVMVLPTFTQVSYSLSPFYQSPNLSDIKGKDNIVKNLIEIQRIRSNISAIKINSNSPNDNLTENSKFIDFYISELNRVEDNFKMHIKTYKDSEADTFLSDTSIYIIQCYILGLREAKFLINNLKGDKTSDISIFYSQQNSIMYYYFMAGDLQLTCLESFLINK
ncbi:hypothetical protein K0040_06750 [Terrisporobacter petrolearius]|uniref:hypothetical protein n=1 Tax=Terrisporobacter petrolearius TaxID=1460447 RepID=UPI001D16691D|nr:hypothetical protein [Terrisporobacter petrolearius]MCC3864011.1 hypothetical protein [Terrisporobacter petrolearius]